MENDIQKLSDVLGDEFSNNYVDEYENELVTQAMQRWPLLHKLRLMRGDSAAQSASTGNESD